MAQKVAVVDRPVRVALGGRPRPVLARRKIPAVTVEQTDLHIRQAAVVVQADLTVLAPLVAMEAARLKVAVAVAVMAAVPPALRRQAQVGVLVAITAARREVAQDQLQTARLARLARLVGVAVEAFTILVHRLGIRAVPVVQGRSLTPRTGLAEAGGGLVRRTFRRITALAGRMVAVAVVGHTTGRLVRQAAKV